MMYNGLWLVTILILSISTISILETVDYFAFGHFVAHI